jgi:glycosyltransferase involved in cell wall biosynthesis
MAWLVDISRLNETLHLRTATGIDRVEMAYVRHFLRLADQHDVRFVVTYPSFTGLLHIDYVRTLIEELSSRWMSTASDLDGDLTLSELRKALNDESIARTARAPVHVGHSDHHKGFSDYGRSAATWMRAALSPLTGSTVRKLRNSRPWYIHVSQFRLNRQRRFAWMTAAHARGLFMLHDLIPMVHPEYCRPGEAERHRSRVETMVNRATVIVANSDYTRRSLHAHFSTLVPRCEVIPLGAAPGLSTYADISPVEASTPYFVVVGTIEPRKNLEFLLTVWRRWVETGNAPHARLVVVGRRGWEIENVASVLDRSVLLAPSVIEAQALSDAGMIALLRGAAALLAPSWVEGFGLPVAEALALGVPVLASDIDAHREVGGSFAEYISPVDGPGWMQALTDYCEPNSQRRQSRVAALKDYRPPTWSDHMARVEQLLAEQ